MQEPKKAVPELVFYLLTLLLEFHHVCAGSAACRHTIRRSLLTRPSVGPKFTKACAAVCTPRRLGSHGTQKCMSYWPYTVKYQLVACPQAIKCTPPSRPPSRPPARPRYPGSGRHTIGWVEDYEQRTPKNGTVPKPSLPSAKLLRHGLAKISIFALQWRLMGAQKDIHTKRVYEVKHKRQTLAAPILSCHPGILHANLLRVPPCASSTHHSNDVIGS